MKSVCQDVAVGRWPSKVQAHAGVIAIPPELQNVAYTFVDLQQKRHQADYDLRQSYRRSQVSAYLDATQELFDDWHIIRTQPVANLFLATLFTYRKIKG